MNDMKRFWIASVIAAFSLGLLFGPIAHSLMEFIVKLLGGRAM